MKELDATCSMGLWSIAVPVSSFCLQVNFN